MPGTKLTRLRAFLGHLAISLLILLALLYVLTQHWYPGVFYHLDGGWDGLKIIMGCDLVLGPLLTLVVFKPGKDNKHLVFDLTCIGLIQITALTAGTWIVYSERPISLVFAGDRFFTMTEYAYQLQETTTPDLSHLPGPTPKRVFIELPENTTAREVLIRESVEQKRPIQSDISRYAPLGENWSKVIHWGGYSIPSILEKYPESTEEVQNWLRENNRTQENTVLIPIAGASSRRFIYCDTKQANILGVTSKALQPGM